MGIVVIGAVFVDIKGFPEDAYIADGRNAGHIEYILSLCTEKAARTNDLLDLRDSSACYRLRRRKPFKQRYTNYIYSVIFPMRPAA